MSLSKFSNRALSKSEMSKVHGGQDNPCHICQMCISSNAGACAAAGLMGPEAGLCEANLQAQCLAQSYCQQCNS
jgi:hypothetical protein